MELYHYTTKENYDQIMASNTLMPSDKNTTMDAHYGTGWYFTDLNTDQCDMWVMRVCWGRVDVPERVTHFLKFDMHQTAATKHRDHVYKVAVWDNTRIKHLGGGANRQCPSKPCHTCEKGKKYL